MTSIMPEGELVRRAAVWICGEKDAKPEKSLYACLDEAGMRFNLSPLEQKMLAALFAETGSICDAPCGGRGI